MLLVSGLLLAVLLQPVSVPGLVVSSFRPQRPAAADVPDRTVGPRAPSPYTWPITPVSVVRRFHPPPEPWLAGHRGVDLAGSVGAPVLAAGSGTVVFAGVVAGRGVVSLAHPGGLRTTYEPVRAERLKVGDAVARGQPIGTLDGGHAGCPAAACLHWGLKHGERYLDPLALLGYGRVRLLPLSGAR